MKKSDLKKSDILSENIKIIVNYLKIFRPISIILYGGYGRGEGSYFFNQKGQLKPYNDYDILLITDNKIENHDLSLAKKNLEDKIDIRWIDLSQMTTKRLKVLEPKIFNYDLKYASKIIYGEKNILDLIPEMSSKDLGLKDADILFKTRMWTLLGSLNSDGFNKQLDADEIRFFRNQMAKALLAVMDILLLQKKAYHFSYTSRTKILKNLYSTKKEVLELVSWAVNEKLHPKAPIMTPKDVKNLYNKVHIIFLSEMLEVLSKYYKISLNSVIKIKFVWKYHPFSLIRRIGYMILRKNLHYEKKIKLEILQFLLILSYNKNNVDEKIFNTAIDFFISTYGSTSIDLSWDEMRVIIAEKRLNQDG